jgi:hypothetical protein
MDIYTKTRNLLRPFERNVIDLAFRTFGNSTTRKIPRNKVDELAVQLKASRAIRRFLDLIIHILGPIHIITEKHPSRFYRSIFGKAILCFFQPILRFRKLLLEFEVFIYAGYFGKISREHYEIFKPHPDFYNPDDAHCFAPKQQG